jgi:long-chain acyl-CoA synthetase
VNLGEIPRRNARRFPRRVGLAFGDTRLTWPEVNARVNRFANALGARGVGAGDRVAILAHNSHRFLEVYWGLAKLGAIAVPLNFRLTKSETTTLLEHSGSRVLVVGDGYEKVAGELPGLKLVVGLDRGGADSYEAMLADAEAGEPQLGAGTDDPFAIMYTSGTTGLPKGAVVTHGNLESNVYNQAIADKADPADVNLVATPLYHMGAVFMGTTYAALGCTNVILERFAAAEVLESIELERVTTCLLVPTMLNMVLNEPSIGQRDLASLRLIFYGGSTITKPVLRRAIETIGCGFTQGYGLTETIEATFLTADDHRLDDDPVHERRLASAGREAVNAEVRVVDDEGRDLPPGAVGEVLIRSPSVIREYWRAPEATREAIRDGWFHTGDLGYRDDDAFLFIVDRKKDMIISGGVNVYPKEVEEVLYAHPSVLEAAVIGLPDDTWGEAVTAVVVARPGRELTEDELLEHCRGALAGYKKPRAVKFVAELPRNPSGKILKRELRATYGASQAVA